jgi:hypothetical protein
MQWPGSLLWTQMNLRYDSWTHLGEGEETSSLIKNWALTLSLLKWQGRKIQVSMSHNVVRCHAQNGMWSENQSCPVLPDTDSPPSQACCEELPKDIRLLWSLSKGDGAWSVQISWGCPSDHAIFLCWVGGEAASTTELHHLRPPLRTPKPGCLGKLPGLTENWRSQTNTVSKNLHYNSMLSVGWISWPVTWQVDSYRWSLHTVIYMWCLSIKPSPYNQYVCDNDCVIGVYQEQDSKHSLVLSYVYF